MAVCTTESVVQTLYTVFLRFTLHSSVCVCVFVCGHVLIALIYAIRVCTVCVHFMCTICVCTAFVCINLRCHPCVYRRILSSDINNIGYKLDILLDIFRYAHCWCTVDSVYYTLYIKHTGLCMEKIVSRLKLVDHFGKNSTHRVWVPSGANLQARRMLGQCAELSDSESSNYGDQSPSTRYYGL